LTQESSICALSFPDKAAKPRLALDSQDAKIEMVITVRGCGTRRWLKSREPERCSTLLLDLPKPYQIKHQDQLDDLAMLCSGQFEAPASHPPRQTVDSRAVTTEGPLQSVASAQDAETLATPVSSASAFVDSTHSSAPMTSKEQDDDHDDDRAQNFREEQRVVQELASCRETLPDLTESLATQDDPIDETVERCSEPGSSQGDAEHAEASGARAGWVARWWQDQGSRVLLRALSPCNTLIRNFHVLPRSASFSSL
jgi:hypothetical protein